VQIRRGGDALVGSDVAGEASARIGRVVGRAQRERVTERVPPGRIGERFLAWSRRLSRGTTQQTRSTIPDAINRAAAITGSSDLPPPGVTAARMSRAAI